MAFPEHSSSVADSICLNMCFELMYVCCGLEKPGITQGNTQKITTTSTPWSGEIRKKGDIEFTGG